MDEENKFENALEIIVDGGSPFPPDAYRFVRDSLIASMKEIRRRESGRDRHISGPELLEGFRRRVLKEFGPMSKHLLDSWNIMDSGDVGKIVFHLIESGTFVGSNHDSREDFENVFDFEEAFVTPFLPNSERGEQSFRA